MEHKSAWLKYSAEEKAQVTAFNEGYKIYLDNGKTERECIVQTVAEAEAAGFRCLEDVLASGEKIKAGDKLYSVCMNKAISMFVIGKQPLEKGMNILGAHIDSPRVDIKSNPCYEADGMAYLDTHYYGGVKKYQWVALPLAMHGVVCKKDGTTITVAIGEKPEDPVFVFTDLLIHISQKQMEARASEVIPAEKLDLLIGNMPLAKADLKEDEKNAVLANVLRILKSEYNIEEEDFLSAELELVPAEKARDLGFDRSMILAYGHDDRICAYTSYKALLQIEDPEKTCVCLLVDKEEVGSVGATGMQAYYFENAVAEIIANMEGESMLKLRHCLANSFMLSSDVSSGYDQLYGDAFEKKNTAFLSCGMSFNKFTGRGGKSGSNDANPEYIAKLRRIFDEADVSYQFCEIGKVDLGGGGTIAYIMAKYGMNVIDSGMPVMSMHAPYEVASKADVWEGYKGYIAFLKNA
ncbi:MAG: aminopeptidase [Firmicutes bacterium]|nr:aminopeptidase [Bacillota bacterium]